MGEDVEIRAATKAEFASAVDWAAAEGWNPGLDDLPAFHAADPAGFLMGFRDGAPITSISVVRYGPDYGFLGFYICHPDHRGTGAGFATWQAGLAHLGPRTIGLDGVPAQQDNYRKSGFALSERNLRYTGVPHGLPERSTIDIRQVHAAAMPELVAYDAAHVPAKRQAFLPGWLTGAASRTARIAVSDGRMTGLGVIRTCRAAAKVGPLFAETPETALALLGALVRDGAPVGEIVLDVPEPNAEGRRMAENLGLRPAFETARMYRGTAPDLPHNRIFGVTTLELG